MICIHRARISEKISKLNKKKNKYGTRNECNKALLSWNVIVAIWARLTLFTHQKQKKTSKTIENHNYWYCFILSVRKRCLFLLLIMYEKLINQIPKCTKNWMESVKQSEQEEKIFQHIFHFGISFERNISKDLGKPSIGSMWLVYYTSVFSFHCVGFVAVATLFVFVCTWAFASMWDWVNESCIDGHIVNVVII